jgi:hypothetical protein
VRDRNYHHGERQKRDAERHVGQPHQDFVDPASKIAGDQADDGAQHDASDCREQPDEHGHARSPK